MGEMLVLMGAADICFMGGSLVGDKVGGHNVLEPAALGVPIINGPSYFNFKEIVDSFVKECGLIIVEDSSTLAKTIIQLIESPKKRIAYHTAGSKIVNMNQGALKNTILEVLN